MSRAPQNQPDSGRTVEQQRYTLETCPKRHRHTRCPDGYVAWHWWAERKSVRHEAVRCPGCGLFAIWKRKPSPRHGNTT